MKDSPELIIPVYLNQRIVFDLVAMLKGGIATITKVSEAHKESSSASGEVAGAFGLSQALASLLRIDLSGKAGGTTEDAAELARSEERVHTPASLFFILRNLLIDKQLLRQDSDDLVPKPGDFIEFTASLKRNPIIETLDLFIELNKFFSALSPDEPSQQKSSKHPKDKQKAFNKMLKEMESMADYLKAGDTLDLTTEKLISSYRAVVTLESKYLNDPSLSDLVDGTFKVVGKVIRVVPKDGGAINLSRKSALSRMPINPLESFAKIFRPFETKHNFSLPKMEWEISGPVIQVHPLAIFA